jgi:hypothetical protein
VGLSAGRDLFLRPVTEREASRPAEAILGALFVIGWWAVGQEHVRAQGGEARPPEVRRP